MTYFLKFFLPLTSGMAPKWIYMFFTANSVDLTYIFHVKSVDFTSYFTHMRCCASNPSFYNLIHRLQEWLLINHLEPTISPVSCFYHTLASFLFKIQMWLYHPCIFFLNLTSFWISTFVSVITILSQFQSFGTSRLLSMTSNIQSIVPINTSTISLLFFLFFFFFSLTCWMVLCAGVKYQKINDSKDKKVRISNI